MRTRLTLKPGQKGTKKLLKRYGDRLVCVRYRYDRERQKRYKTVELIVEEVDWEIKSPMFSADTVVEVRVEWVETEMREKVKRVGGIWNPDKKVWEITYGQAERLGMTQRIIGLKDE